MWHRTAVARHTDARGPSSRLGYFVLVSLLLHGLALLLWRGEPPAGPPGRSTFQITLLARHGDSSSSADAETGQRANSLTEQSLERADSSSGATPIAEPGGGRALPATGSMANRQTVSPIVRDRQRPVLRRRVGGTNESHHEAAERRKLTAAKQQAASSRGNTLSRAGATSHGQQQLSTSARYRKVRAALQEALLPRFDYPSVARRRGWQGRVRIALHVEADGDLTRIHLLESSGYPLLDKAAVKNVTELRTVPAVTQWLGGHDMDVILPVRYQLQKP